MMRDWYYYYQLNQGGKTLYKRLLEAYEKRKEKVLCDGLGVRASDLSQVFSAVEYDNPDLFYVNFKEYRYSVNEGSDKVYSVLLDYLFSVDDYNKLYSVVENSARKIISRLSVEGCSDYNKVLKLHDLLAENVDYFSEALSREGSFEWYRSQTILGLLLDKKSVCVGISKAYKYLLNQIGVRSIVVTGTALNEMNVKEGHAWNIVKINGNSYHVDMTWDIAISKNRLRSYNYFNLNDSMIFRDHYTDSVLPACSSIEDNYFEKYGKVIHSISDWHRYLSENNCNGNNDFYVRIDYKCDLDSEVKRIEEYIKRNSRDLFVRWQTTKDERQNIIRVTVQK